MIPLSQFLTGSGISRYVLTKLLEKEAPKLNEFTDNIQVEYKIHTGNVYFFLKKPKSEKLNVVKIRATRTGYLLDPFVERSSMATYKTIKCSFDKRGILKAIDEVKSEIGLQMLVSE